MSHHRRRAHLLWIFLTLAVIALFGLAGCDLSGGNSKPPSDPSAAAQQTVAAIYTQTAAAKGTAAANSTPFHRPGAGTPGVIPTEQAAQPVVETPGGEHPEPTRNVKMEAESKGVTLEPYHEPTMEAPAKK